MQLIPVSTSARPLSRPPSDACHAALAGLIDSIGRSDFGPAGLAQLNRWMPLCWWSIYRVFDDAPPSLHALGGFGVPDGTRQSWKVYRESLYRLDQTLATSTDKAEAKISCPKTIGFTTREVIVPSRMT